jgi:Ca2+-binding EF-hand superfamily protein
MRAKLFVLVGIAGLLAATTEALTQFPPPGGGFSRGKGRMDPNEFFDRVANGKNVWSRAESTSPFAQAIFDRMAERLGITNGQITREQYMAYAQQRAAERAAGVPPGMSSPSATGGPSADPRAPSSSSAAQVDQWAEMWFRRHDVNGDGLLNFDEMPESLRAERDKWDTNKDGFIDLNEYKAFFRARMEQRMAERGSSGFGQGSADWAMQAAITPPPDQDEPKPVVYRAGKLPKELPAWFRQLDTDNDGQIGLYEWKASGRSLDEFQAIDRNNDGFLTVEEVLRYEAKRRGTTTQVASADPGSDSGRGMSGPGAPTTTPSAGTPGDSSRSFGGPPGSRGGRGGGRGGRPGGPPSR